MNIGSIFLGSPVIRYQCPACLSRFQILDIGFLIINPVCPKVEEDQDDSGIESKRQAQARSYLALLPIYLIGEHRLSTQLTVFFLLQKISVVVVAVHKP